jgi:hypothetical protein
MEEVAAEAARVADKAAREAAVAAATREAVFAKEIAEEAAAEGATREEMARDPARWGEDMAAARRAHKIHELANEHRHCQRLARHQARHVSQTNGEGSNAGDAGWGDAAM